jgi:hypothetical protein
LPDEEFARMTEIKREVCRLEIRFLIFIWVVFFISHT